MGYVIYVLGLLMVAAGSLLMAMVLVCAIRAALRGDLFHDADDGRDVA
jgi:hypothetical protein